jgi:hypothetical protein
MLGQWGSQIQDKLVEDTKEWIKKTELFRAEPKVAGDLLALLY